MDTLAGPCDVRQGRPAPKLNGCICQTCAARGVECQNVCETAWDEQCGACLDGHHAADEKGRPTRRFVAELR